MLLGSNDEFFGQKSKTPGQNSFFGSQLQFGDFFKEDLGKRNETDKTPRKIDDDLEEKNKLLERLEELSKIVEDLQNQAMNTQKFGLPRRNILNANESPFGFVKQYLSIFSA